MTTNEWLDAVASKPWRNRLVLVRMEDGAMRLGKWNGMYWSTQSGLRLEITVKATHFYIFEKFPEEDC